MKGKCKVFEDGKLCRDSEATIKKISGNKMLIQFYSVWEDALVEDWFKKVRRDRGGIWESYEHNYYYIGKLSKGA